MITIAEVNAACSLERNSLVFLQAARSGLTHEHVLRHIVSSARQRAGLPPHTEATPGADSTVLLPTPAREVWIHLELRGRCWCKTCRAPGSSPRLWAPPVQALKVPRAQDACMDEVWEGMHQLCRCLAVVWAR